MDLSQIWLQPDSGREVQDADLEENEAPFEVTLTCTVHNFSKLKNQIWSGACYVRDLSWKILVEPIYEEDGTAQRSLGVYLFVDCNGDDDDDCTWSCYAVGEFRLLSVRPNVKPFSLKLQGLFNSKNYSWGYQDFMAWNDVLDPEKGYIKNDEIILEVYVVADVQHSISLDKKIYTDDRIDQSLLNELKNIKETVKIDSLDLSKVDSKGQVMNIFNKWKNERIEKIQDEWKKLCVAEDMLNSLHFRGYADESLFENVFKILPLEMTNLLAEKKRNEPNLYMTINVLLENNFNGHQGYDLYDPNHPSFRIFKIKKVASVSQMMKMFSEAFKYPTKQMRLWPFIQRLNGTMRPSLLHLEAESNLTVNEAAEDKDTWTIFLELLPPDSGFTALPSFNEETDTLLFFKMYDPKHKKIRYCGHSYFIVTNNLEDLIPVLNKRAGFPPDTKLVLYEEIAPNMVEKITNYSDPLEKAIEELRIGDIILFEKEKQEELSDLPTCIDYFKDLYYRVEITFVDKCMPNDSRFTMQLSQRMTYDQMVRAVAQRFGTDPTLLQFFKCQNSKDSLEQALSCTFKDTLKDLLEFSETKTSTKIFYQHELEKKRFKCLYVGLNVFEEKELILYPNKRDTVRDLLEEAKNQIEFGEQSTRQLRLTEVIFHKVALGPTENTPLDQLVLKAAKIFRIEEVPRDELHITEDEMLIPCAHFEKVVVNTFGSPFLFKIKQGEPFIMVKERIQKRLGVSHDEFEKYKFLIVAMGKQQVLNDEEYIVDLADFRLLPNQAGNPKPWLGLDHVNKV